MKIKYDKEVDVLYIKLNDTPIIESDEKRKGVIIDYAADRKIVSIEIFNASKNLAQPSIVEYEVA